MPEDSLNVQKIFRTSEELNDAEEAYIQGKIPDYLKGGAFIRVGPGKFDFDSNFSMGHWLDGYALLSRFEITEDNTVKFTKKFLQSESYKRALVANRPVFCEYGTKAFPDPQKGFFSKLTTRLIPIELTDNDALSLFTIGPDLYASSETCYFTSVDPCDLSTLTRADTNKCMGLNVASAHPLIDPWDQKTVYQLGSTLLNLKGPRYEFVSFSNGKNGLKEAKKLCSIESSYFGAMSFNHSFGMSENYLVFIEQPYVMNVGKAVKSAIKGSHSFQDWLEWRGESGARNKFYIVHKKTGKILKTPYFSSTPFFFLHIINCFEDSSFLTIDINTYKNTHILKSMCLSKLRSGDVNVDIENQPIATRFVVPLTNEISSILKTEDLLDDYKTDAKAWLNEANEIILEGVNLTEPGFELPIINKERHLGRNYNFIYATGSVSRSLFKSSIAKINVKRKEVKKWKESEDQVPGEPLFIMNPAGISEDDGVLVSCVTDTGDGKDDFIIFIDAKSMEEIGRANFKAHVPQAIHGIFIK